MNASTAGLIKAIQTGRRKLGMTDEEYHALLEGVSGRTSSKELTAYQLKEVLRRMREAGFRTSITTEPQLQKIRSLWFSMYNEGIVKSKTEQSISAYILRITKKSVNACGVKDLQRVIETLKQWIDRLDDSVARERLRKAFVTMPAASPLLQ